VRSNFVWVRWGLLLFVSWTGGVEGQVGREPVGASGSRVEGELLQRTRSVEILDRELWRSLPVRTLSELLRWALGVEGGRDSTFRGEVGLRGGGPSRFLLLIDGRRVEDPASEAFDLALALPLDRVERIEILRGPAAGVRGGGAIAGVIHVVSRDPTAWGFRVEEGAFGTRIWAGEAGVPLGRAKIQVAGERGSSEGHRPGTDGEQRIGSVLLQLPFRSGMWRADLGRGEREGGADGLWGDLQARDSLEVTSGSVSWLPSTQPPSPLARPARFWLEPRVSWRRQEGGVHGETWEMDARSDQQAGELWGKFRPSDRLRVAVGGEFVETRRFRSDGEQVRAEGWGWGGEVAWVDSMGIEGAFALQWDRRGPGGEFASPHFTLGFPAGDGVQVRASWGRSFRRPRWMDTEGFPPLSEASPDLRPETAEEGEVGFRWADREGFELDLSVFRRILGEEIVRFRPEGGGPWKARNLGRSRLEGVEAEARWDLGGGNRVFAGGLWLTSTPAEDLLESDRPVWVPLRDQFRVGGVHRLPDGAFVTLLWIQSRKPGEESWGEMEGRLAIPFLAGLLYLDGRNLTRSEGQDRTGNPLPRRNWTVGYRLGSR